MLASAATIEVIADTLKEYDIKSIILDPVCHEIAMNGMPSVQKNS